MTTDELIIVLRESAGSDELSFRYARKLLNQAADRLEEQEKIINQYHRADTFLNAHGWKWRDEEDDHR